MVHKFLIYTNDISYCVDSTCRLYADDCILYRRIDSLHDTVILQRDLLQLEHLSKQWKMLFNIDKCTVLTVTLKQHPFVQSISCIINTWHQFPQPTI